MHGRFAPRGRALVWGAGSIVAVVVLAGVAGRTAAPRAGRGAPASVGLSADDLEARLDRARRLVRERDLAGVWEATQYVLARSPGHPRALAYQALVLLARGDGEAAVTQLRQAVDADPDLLEARQNLVYAYARLGRVREAEAAVAETSRRFPAEGARLKRALEEFTAMAGDAPVVSHPR